MSPRTGTASSRFSHTRLVPSRPSAHKHVTPAVLVASPQSGRQPTLCATFSHLLRPGDLYHFHLSCVYSSREHALITCGVDATMYIFGTPGSAISFSVFTPICMPAESGTCFLSCRSQCKREDTVRICFALRCAINFAPAHDK